MTATRDKFGRPIVVVTGMGVVTSLGSGKTDNWAKLTAGESGIRTITRFPTDGLKTTMAGTVDFVPVEPFSSTDLSERLADIATEEAIAQSAIGSKGDFPGPLFLAVAPIEVEWPQREELGRAISETDIDYDAILRVSGGGRYTGYHRRFLFGSVADHLAEAFGTKGSPISLSTAPAPARTASRSSDASATHCRMPASSPSRSTTSTRTAPARRKTTRWNIWGSRPCSASAPRKFRYRPTNRW